MGFHKILAKAERAVIAYLISEGAANGGSNLDIFRSKCAETISRFPFTIVDAVSWSEAQEHSGALMVKLNVEVHDNAIPNQDDDRDEMVENSDTRAELTDDALTRQNPGASDGTGLADEITAAATDVSDFTCLNARLVAGEQGRDRGPDRKGGEWIDIFTLELLCMNADES